MEDFEHSFLQEPFPVDLVKIGLSKQTSILCFAKESSKVFAAFKIVQEIQRRSPGKCTLVVSHNTSDTFTRQLVEAVDLQTSLTCITSTNQPTIDRNKADVQIVSPCHVHSCVTAGSLVWPNINLMIINDILDITYQSHDFRVIMDHVKSHDVNNRPVILGLSSRLPVTVPCELQSTLNKMETLFDCCCSLSCDLVALNRYGEPPQEGVVNYSCEIKTKGMSLSVSSKITSILEFLWENDKSDRDKSSQEVLSRITMLFHTCNGILKRFGVTAAEHNIKIIIRELTKLEKKTVKSEDLETLHFCKEMLSLIQQGFSDNCDKTQLVTDILSSLWVVKAERRNSINIGRIQTNEISIATSTLLNYIERYDQTIKKTPVSVILCVSDYEAAALNFILNKVAKTDPSLSCIKSAYLSSSNIRQSEACQDVDEVQSQAIIQLINQGEVNVLVVSCEVECDIYLPSCKQLLRFGIPKDYISYVKVKRILKRFNAEVIFLVEDGCIKENETKLYESFKEIESVLSKRCEQLKSFGKDKAYWDKLNNSSQAEQNPAFEDDSRLAIPLVNRYCSSFPNDDFGSSHPEHLVKIKEQTDSIIVESTLYLPSHSPLYWPFQGSVIIPKEHATQRHFAEARSESSVAAAMLACKALIETGELEQGPRLSAENFTFKKANVPCSYEVVDGCYGDEGSTKRRRAYNKKLPSVLVNNLPTAKIPCYVYSISIETSKNSSENGDQVQNYISSNMLGLLSRNKLPRVPKFIIYKKATELTVSIKECADSVTITADELALIQRFHWYIHCEILKINGESREGKLFCFDPDNQTYGFYIVPLEEKIRCCCQRDGKEILSQELSLRDNKEDVEVDSSYDGPRSEEQLKNQSLNDAKSSRPIAFDFLFDIEQKLGSLFNPKEPIPQKYTNYERYRGCIVTAVNMKTPIFFVVTDILYNMSPLSPFPNPEVALTFADYFEQRYGLQVKTDQPLLQVKNVISKVKSCLVSKYRDARGRELPHPSKESKRKKKAHILLIPELCSIHPLTSSFRQDALFIPTILHRLEAILVAEELRHTIAMHSGAGCVHWPETVDLPVLTTGEGLGEDQAVSPLEVKSLQKTEIKILESQEDNGGNILCIFSTNLEDKMRKVKLGNSAEDEDLTSEKFCPSKKTSDEDETQEKPSFAQLNKASNQQSNHIGSIKFLENSLEFQQENTFPRQESSSEDLIQEEPSLAHTRKSLEMEQVERLLESQTITSKESFHEEEMSGEDIVVRKCSNRIIEQSSPIGEGNQLQMSLQEPKPIYEESLNRKEYKYQKELCKETSPGSFKPITVKAILSETLQISQVKDPSEDLDACSVESLSTQESLDQREMKEPSSTLIIKALTCVGAIDVFNHDRLEMYGDCFIKFAVSLNMYCESPFLNVGKLSFYRGLKISNRQLFYLGRALNIPSYIYNVHFQPAVSWYPHGFKRLKKPVNPSGRMKLNLDTHDAYSSESDDESYQTTTVVPAQNAQLEFDEQKHVVASDKSIADTTEAIIGAYLITGGANSALSVMDWLGMDVRNYLNNYKVPSIVNEQTLFTKQANGDSSGEVRFLEAEFQDVENSIGYSFTNKYLLAQAFAHVTYPRDGNHLRSSYEQLEFLGDALLDYLVTKYLYFTYKDVSPGYLTDFRSAMVNSYSFAFLSVQHGLHRYLRSLSPAVFRVVNRFTAMLKKKMVVYPNQIFAKVFVPPDDNDENNEGIEVPKVMADIFESVIAAVFIDTGMDVERTWVVVYKLLQTTFDHYANHPPCSPVRMLKEMFPMDVNFTSCVMSITGQYSCHVTVKGFGKFKGTGRSLKIARSTAAQRALAHIEDKQKQSNSIK